MPDIQEQFKGGNAVFLGTFIEAEQMTGQQLRPYTKRKKVIKERCLIAVWVEQGEITWSRAKEYFELYPLSTKTVIGKSIYKDMVNEYKNKRDIPRVDRKTKIPTRRIRRKRIKRARINT